MTVPHAKTKADLDRMAAAGCEIPGCTHEAHNEALWLHAACHATAGPWVSYLPGSGELVLTCSVCGTHILTVAVAEG